jgi:dTDP-4-dehydrorhamnose 3,5-epimerase
VQVRSKTLPFSVTQTKLAGVLLVEPKVFGDERGFFFESYNERDFLSTTGLNVRFVQDNHSRSKKGVLRGLHYQIDHAQGKLVRVAQGIVFDVCVNLQRKHPQFGQWTGVLLSGENKRQLWVPPGFAHGFLVLRDDTDVLYKTTDYYSPKDERCLKWDDSTLAIEWPLDQIDGSEPTLTEKDRAGSSLIHAETFP